LLVVHKYHLSYNFVPVLVPYYPSLSVLLVKVSFSLSSIKELDSIFRSLLSFILVENPSSSRRESIAFFIYPFKLSFVLSAACLTIALNPFGTTRLILSLFSACHLFLYSVLPVI